MSIPAHVTGFKTYGYHTETAATVIDEEVPGKDGKTLALTNFEYLAAATAHDVSFMFAQGTGTRVATTAAAAAAQKVINVDVAPKDPAGSDCYSAHNRRRPRRAAAQDSTGCACYCA